MQRTQCRFCQSRSCYCRIVTPELSFDEVACRIHIKELHTLADQTLNGKLRMHISSTGKLSRKEPYPITDEGE